MKRVFRRPSPAMLVAIAALIVALGGTAVAGGVLNKKKVKNISNNQITQRAPGLSVASAGTAKSADTAKTVSDAAITAAKLAPDSVIGSKLGTIVERDAVSASIAAGASGSATAQCTAGEQFLSGGNDGFTVDGYQVVASRSSGTNGWTVFLFNCTAVARTVTAHVYCLQ